MSTEEGFPSSYKPLVHQQVLTGSNGRRESSYGSTGTTCESRFTNRGSASVQHSESEGASTAETDDLSMLLPAFPRRCSYRYSPIQSKGAILVLVWNFLIFSSVSGIYSILLKSIVEHVDFVPSSYAWTLTVVSIVRAIVWIAYPLVGWLADTYFGRYHTLVYGMWIMWAGSLVLLVCAVVVYIHSDNTQIDRILYLGVYPVLFIAVSIGLAGFQAIVIPFGTDQMPGGSSDQLAAFILWYFWTENFGFGVVYSYLISCQLNWKVVSLIQTILQFVLISVALVSNQLFRKVLDTQRAGGNPLKTIHEVLKFARKHKYPQRRSAFTYWEDNEPSRLDLAKRRYGGSHTTEQVEDVKTFFRILAVLSVVLIVCVGNVALDTTSSELLNHLKHSSTGRNGSLSACYASATIDNLRTHVIILGVPLYHFLIHPFVRNFVPTILRRLILGFIMTTLSLLAMTILEAVGHALTNPKVDLSCVLTASPEDPKMNLDYRWLVIPNIMAGLAYIMVGSTLFEFVCAQAPHSMKGFILGMVYSLYGVASAIGFLVVLAFYLAFSGSHPPKPVLGCGFWYYTMGFIISGVGLLVFVCVAKWYKLRTRDDLSFEPVRVERYYENTTSAKRESK